MSSHKLSHNTDDLKLRWELRHDQKEDENSELGDYIERPLMGLGDIVEIPLSNSFRVAIIDKRDSDLSKLRWHIDHTGVRGGGERGMRLARLILSRKLNRRLGRNEICDFVNHNSFDCRRCNLRLATLAQIRRHRRRFSNNESGYKGVTFMKDSRKYRARIYFNGRQIILGRFNTAYQAHLVYCRAADTLFGKFACYE